MYKSFFGLKESPFNVNPDPRFLYFTKQIEETLTGLMYGIQTRKGFITLTGEVGTGKTTLINRLLDWLHHRRARTAFLFNSRMNTNQLFDFILAEFDIPCESKSKSQQLMKLNHWLSRPLSFRRNRCTDYRRSPEPHLSGSRRSRLLTNLETSTEKLLQIVLSGQPELEEKLKASGTAPIAATHHAALPDLRVSKEETSQYVLERLKTAGASVRADLRSQNVGYDSPLFSGDPARRQFAL